MPRHDGTDNLVPLNKRTKEEQRKITSKGGKASAAKRRREKQLSDVINASWNSNIVMTDKTRVSLEKIGYDFDARGDPTAMDIMVATIMTNAMNGDLSAFEVLARYGLVPDIKSTLERERMEIQREQIKESQRERNEKPMNNLVEALKESMRGVDQDAIPELQSPPEPDGDLVDEG